MAGACSLALGTGAAYAHSPQQEYGADGAAQAGLTDGQFLHHFTLDAAFPAGEAGARPTSSDIAFWGNYAYAGNYNGFRIFDITSKTPVQLSDTRCIGAQGDPSVFDRDGNGAADTLVLSVDRTLTKSTCDGVPTTHDNPAGWEGLRIFDVSDPRAPRFITGVYQDCGSHTNTLLPAPADRAGNNGKGKGKGKKIAADSIYVLNSSYPLRPGPTCGPLRGPENGRAANHGVVQVVEIPFDAPSQAKEIAELPITYPGDADGTYRPITEQGLNGGVVVPNALLDDFLGCHDLSVFPAKGIIGAACGEQAQVWEIDKKTGLPDTTSPRWVYDQANVDFWHSATFSWDGEVANFIDESFGEGCPTTTIKPDLSTADTSDLKEYQTGNMFFFDTKKGSLLSEYRIPRGTNDGRTTNEYCSSHLGVSVPSTNRYLLVNAYYRGGSSVIDYSNPSAPREIAYADLQDTDTWSAYPYPRTTGTTTEIPVYSNDGVHTPNSGYGFQAFTADIGSTEVVGLQHFNPQVQEEALKVKLDKKAKAAKRVKTYAKGKSVSSRGRANRQVIIREAGR